MADDTDDVRVLQSEKNSDLSAHHFLLHLSTRHYHHLHE